MTKIKITARDSTTALDEVSKKLGADAYILSTTSNQDGVEIEATNDLQEVKKLAAPQRKAFSGVIEKELNNVSNFPVKMNSKNNVKPYPRINFGQSDSLPKVEILEIQSNLKKIQEQLNGMFLTDINGLSVELGQSISIKLNQAKFEPEVIKMLRPSFEGLNYERGRKAFMKAIAEKLSAPSSQVGHSFILGLSGVGKSTLAAKMAALRNVGGSKNNLVLASLDNDQNNLNETLRSFARMLNIPMIKLTNDNAMETLVNVKDNVIIDVSMKPTDSFEIIEALKKFWGPKNVETILAINGSANQNTIKNQGSFFSKLKPNVAITKLDECEISAREVSQYLLSDFKISYLTGSKSILGDLAVSNKEILEQYFIENC